MKDELLKKLETKKDGQLNDDELDKVTGGKGNDEEKPVEVVYKYKVGQFFSENVCTRTKTANTLTIRECRPTNNSPSYSVYVEIWKDGTLIGKGEGGVMEDVIDGIVNGDSYWTIENVAKGFHII